MPAFFLYAFVRWGLPLAKIPTAYGMGYILAALRGSATGACQYH
jgi:hypothetical protein